VTTFIAICAVCLGLNLVYLIVCLAMRHIPQRTLGTMAYDAISTAAVCGWAIYLLAKG
jgi:uncharacterized membrane protein YozB (DUF420 family)